MSKLGKIIFSNDITSKTSEILSRSNLLCEEISTGFNRSNILYGLSSAIEDIVLEDYLSMQNTTNAINVGNASSNLVIESFTSTDYMDQEFPVDSSLNIDVQNGDLTLPIKSTTKLTVSDILIGSESNGSIGNSTEGGINNNVTTILNSNSSELFEYESIVSPSKSTTLTLALTLKLKAENYANGIYVRTFTSDSISYPEVVQVMVSKDGASWESIDYVSDVNKSDHYIRFQAKKIRFAKIVLSQDSYVRTSSYFNDIKRYSIGLKEISIKQTEYKKSGEYVSIPFNKLSNINAVYFVSKEDSNNDIKYYISADNGSKWVEVENEKLLYLTSGILGLYNSNDVKSIRVKVLMDRALIYKPVAFAEYTALTSDNKYFLSYTPISISSMKAKLGGHISCGDAKSYEVSLYSSNQVDSEIVQKSTCIIDTKSNFATTLKYVPYFQGIEDYLKLKINDVAVKNSRSIYNVIRHINPLHSILVFNKNAFLSKSVPSANLSIEYKPHIHNNVDLQTQTITLPDTLPIFTSNKGDISITTVEYTNIIVENGSHPNLFDRDVTTYQVLDTKADVGGVNCWSVTTGEFSDYVCPKQYSITPYADDPLQSPSEWTVEGSTDGTKWTTIDTQSEVTDWDFNKKYFKLDNDCYFKYIRFKITKNSNPVDNSTLTVCDIDLYEGEGATLSSASFEIIDNRTIKILDESYNLRSDYIVEYYPSVDVTSYLPDALDENKIELQGLPDIPDEASLCFEYQYQNKESTSGKEFYSPICNEYRVELLWEKLF